MAEEIGEVFWKEMGATVQGYVLALTGKASEAVHEITSGIAACRSMGATVWLPKELSYLAKAYAELGQFDDAWRCIEEAITHIETTKERWWEAEVNRLPAKSLCCRRSPTPPKQKRTSSALLPSPVNNEPNPGNSAPP